jgi:hypothetical protein
MSSNIDWTPPETSVRPQPEDGGLITQSHGRSLRRRHEIHKWRRAQLTELAKELVSSNAPGASKIALRILRITAAVPSEEDDTRTH